MTIFGMDQRLFLFEHWYYPKSAHFTFIFPIFGTSFRIYLIWAYSQVLNKITNFLSKWITSYSLSALHSSSLYSNLKKIYIYVYIYILNCSTFYHYWLKDEPCYGPLVRLPFIVVSSKLLEKLRKLLVSAFLVLIKILDWSIVARISFSFKLLFKLMFVVLNFLFLQKS